MLIHAWLWPRGKTSCSENLSAVVGRLHVSKREWSISEVDKLCSSCCSLGCWIKGSNCVLVLDNPQLPYLAAYNALFVLLRTASNLFFLFLWPIIAQLNAHVYYNTPENILDVHHLVDLPSWMSDSRQYVCCLLSVLWLLNRRISLYSVTQCTKTEEIFLSAFNRKVIFEAFSSCCVTFCLLGKI